MLVLDQKVDFLSAAVAIRDMLKGDPNEGDGQDVPLFRIPGTKTEIRYDTASEALRQALTRARYPESASGLHCLRVGGATAYANAPKGGEMIATMMGGWTSKARRLYMWACQQRLSEVSLEVGRGKGKDVVAR